MLNFISLYYNAANGRGYDLYLQNQNYIGTKSDYASVVKIPKS